MSISTEYLIRTGLIRDFAKFPCSVFFSSKNAGDRLVVSVTRRSPAFSMKTWNLQQCDPSQALPPMYEKIVDDPFEDIKSFSSEFTSLEIQHKSIPSGENSVKQPMPEDRYRLYFDGHLSNFEDHKLNKDVWLWNAFLSVYYPQLIVFGMSVKRTIGFYGKYAETEITNDQKEIVEKLHPKIWRCWMMWKKHMLDFDGPPGEFLFFSI